MMFLSHQRFWNYSSSLCVRGQSKERDLLRASHSVKIVFLCWFASECSDFCLLFPNKKSFHSSSKASRKWCVWIIKIIHIIGMEAFSYIAPFSSMLYNPSPPMIRWSSTLLPKMLPACLSRLVTSKSHDGSSIDVGRVVVRYDDPHWMQFYSRGEDLRLYLLKCTIKWFRLRWPRGVHFYIIGTYGIITWNYTHINSYKPIKCCNYANLYFFSLSLISHHIQRSFHAVMGVLLGKLDDISFCHKKGFRRIHTVTLEQLTGVEPKLVAVCVVTSPF